MADEPSSANTNRVTIINFLTSIPSKLIDHFGSVLVAGIVSLTTIFWNDIISLFDSHILATVSSDLKQHDKSAVYASIRESIDADMRSDKGLLLDDLNRIYQGSIKKIYGEITFGSLTLSAFNAEQEIKIFVPPDHYGVIHMQVDNLPSGVGVRVLTRVGTWGFVCNSAPVLFDIQKLLVGKPGVVGVSEEATADLTPGQQVDATQDSKYFQNLYTLTLSLTKIRMQSGKCKAAAPELPARSSPVKTNDRPNAAKVNAVDINADIPTSVLVTYIAVISPPLKTDELQ